MSHSYVLIPKNLTITENAYVISEHSILIDVDNQVLNRLWQECCALAFLLIYDICALPTVFLYVGICWGYWYDHQPNVSLRYLQLDGYCYLSWELVSPSLAEILKNVISMFIYCSTTYSEYNKYILQSGYNTSTIDNQKNRYQFHFIHNLFFPLIKARDSLLSYY